MAQSLSADDDCDLILPQKCSPSLSPTLHIAAQHDIALSRQRLWESLNDPQILRQCIQGCDKLERISDDEFCATFRLRVGPLKRTFDAQLHIVDAKPPAEYRLRSTMEAGMVGKLCGVAEIKLERVDDQKTKLHYDAQVDIDGWIGRLGAKALRHVANKYMQRFFDRLIDIIEANTSGNVKCQRSETASGNATKAK